jgi:AcrR family transcriptional regulator
MPEPRPLRRRGAAVHAAILQAALSEIVESGIGGVTVAAVADRAGVHETSIYRRWRTREDLIVAAVVQLSDIQIPPPDTGSLRGDLISLANMLSALLSQPAGRALVATAALTVEDPTLAGVRGKFVTARLEAMRVVIQRAIEREEVAPSTDARLALEMVIAPLHLRALITGESLTEELSTHVVDMLLTGLVPRPAGRLRSERTGSPPPPTN